MCEVLEVSRAGYYKWRNREPSKREVENHRLLQFLLATAKEEHGIPGYRKLWQAAMDAGFICCQNKVQYLLQGVGYRSCTATKPGYQKPKPGMAVLPNLLSREFNVASSNSVWVSDITQLRCLDGWLYVAIIEDLFSRAIVGWAASCVNNAELVEAALESAWNERRPLGSALMFHSDQGCQYRSELVISWLNRRNVTISMSRRGNCWDNACAESFFAQMKKEWFKGMETLTRSETRIEVQYYIEEYYNQVRRHGTLNGLSPMTFERQAAETCLLY